VLEAARAVRARVLVVSSAEVYGIQRPERMPLDETAVLRPGNAYAASKVAAETYALAWHRSYGLDVVVARPFNHIGPGQDERFVVASFARQLADIAAARRRCCVSATSSPTRFPRRARRCGGLRAAACKRTCR